jgi:hypothetical protein
MLFLDYIIYVLHKKNCPAHKHEMYTRIIISMYVCRRYARFALAYPVDYEKYLYILASFRK